MGFRKYFFGKHYLKSNNKEKIKILERTIYFHAICFFIIFFCFFFMFFYFIDINFTGYEQIQNSTLEIVDITYDNLTERQIINFNSILGQINPLYIKGYEKIIVTTNMSKYSDNERVMGQNLRDGELIIVKYRDIEGVGRTLCHEFLHSFFVNDNGDTQNHQIIYDLAKKKVCYGSID